MKEKIFNYDNLKEEDITEVVVRVKAFLINEDNQILLGYSHNTYQFPGGHLEENESLMECLKREVKEETGINLIINDINPFMIIKHYNKDWPEEGENRLSKIYYYVINTNDKIDYEGINYTEHEKEGNFELRYIDLKELEKVLIDNRELYPENEVIVEEMLNAFKEYRNVSNIL